MTDPEELFGIHPAEAAYRLMLLSPQQFRIVELYAAGEPTKEIAKKLAMNYNLIRVRLGEIRPLLEVEESYGIARIWYAAQFLYVYQEEESDESQVPR